MLKQKLAREIEPTVTRWREDVRAIAQTMVDHMKLACEGWRHVTTDDLTIHDCSGFGGGKTFKISCEVSNPSQIVLHILPESLCLRREKAAHFDRIKQGQKLLSKAGLGPRRICDDPLGHWYVEEYLGDPLPNMPSTARFVEEVADLLAELHALNSDWGVDVRREFCSRHPGLRDAPAGNHVWWFATKPHHFINHVSDKELRRYIQAGPKPASRSGARLVTSHGDLHRGNLIRDNGVLKLIDLESLVVNFAIHDLCYAAGIICDTRELTADFAARYLQSSGQPAAQSDVFDLLLDMERCKMATNHYDAHGIWKWLGEYSIISDLDGYQEYARVANDALSDKQFAHDIVTLGFDGTDPVKRLNVNRGMTIVDMSVTLHKVMPSETERTAFSINWDGTIQCEPFWRGLVLGLNADNEVTLRHWTDHDQILRLDMTAVPITGLQSPTADVQPLYLSGRYANQALVLSPHKIRHFENFIEYAVVGAAKDALSVVLTKDGLVRIAESPRHAFDCENGRLDPGARVLIFPAHKGEHQQFAVNDDLTVSPQSNRCAVLGIRYGDLYLVERGSVDQLNFTPELLSAQAGAARATFGDCKSSSSRQNYKLSLASHSGLALSIDHASDAIGHHALKLVSEDVAVGFVIGKDHLSLPRGNGRLALGIPKPKLGE